MKAIIIEDEPNSRESLKDDLRQHCPDLKVIGEADGVRSGALLVKELNPDLVFLDIELSDGTGFDLLEKLYSEKQPGFHVIFTTSHNQFAIKAIRFSALDYLLKPIDPDELAAAVKKATARISPGIQGNHMQVLLNHARSGTGQPPKIALATADSIAVYRVDEIIRCESERNYTRFHFTAEKPLLVSRTLKDFEELLSAHRFERIHNSHLINIDHVKKYVKSDGGYLLMQDGSRVPVAQSKKEHVQKLIASL